MSRWCYAGLKKSKPGTEECTFFAGATIFTAAVGSILFFAICGSNIYECIKVKVAPKVVLLEYVKSVVDGRGR